jgi:LysM repeat protein
LAGTVIYSTEHRLEPPYTVRPGETLEDIARQHNVPWQLLGKINSVPQASQLRPGQQLKVVRGPFEGELDLQRNLLALKIDGRYAGKFPISAPPDVSLPPGSWVVQEKPTAPATQASVYGATDPSRVAVSRSILLRNATATAANPGVPVQIGAGPGADAAASAMNDLRTNGPTPLLIKVSPRDAEELSDILSVGSRIVIRR